MTYESLLKGTTWKTQAEEQDAANLAESKQAMETAAASVFITIDRLGRKIHGRFGDDEQVEANQAVTDMLTQLDDMLTGNSGQIMDGFTVQAGATEAHANELESVRGQLSTAQQTNEELRRSATEASDLRNLLTAKEEELRLANLEVDRMSRDADKPNPLKSENDRLTRENLQLTGRVQTLQTDLDNEKEAHAATKHELEQLQQQLTDAPPVVTPPPTLIDQPAPPAAASSDEPGEAPPPLTHKEELKRRRGWRGLADGARSVAPGSGNPHNTPKEGEK